MSNFKIIWHCLLLVTSISLQYNTTVAACTVRFFPDWNCVMEGMITICTLPTVLTKFIHSIFKWNILALLNIRDFCPNVKLYQCTVENVFKIPQKWRPHDLLMVINTQIMHHNEWLIHIMGLWLLITTGQMFL